MNQKQELLREYRTNDSTAIPLGQVRVVLETVEYASVERVMFQMLFYTGCRITEMDNMRWEDLHNGEIWWRVGKNQTGWRQEELPKHYLEELEEYREINRVRQRDVFGVSSSTFRRYFNRDCRPQLPAEWQQKVLVPRGGLWKREFCLQLKGLRKTFATYQFAKEYKRWQDSGLALEMASKRMCHSTNHITAKHYIRNFQALGLERDNLPDDELALALEVPAQHRLRDFGFPDWHANKMGT